MQELAAALDTLRDARLLAIDTEFTVHHGKGLLCLVQLSTHSQNLILDI